MFKKIKELCAQIDLLNQKVEILEFQRDVPLGMKLMFEYETENSFICKEKLILYYLHENQIKKLYLPYNKEYIYIINSDKTISKNNYLGNTIKKYKIDYEENLLIELPLDEKEIKKNKENLEKIVKDLPEIEDEKPTKKKVGVNLKGGILQKFYINNSLNLDLVEYKPVDKLNKIQITTLLYLFDQYKYIDKILKVINLSKTTLQTYAYLLKKAGYLVYRDGMGKVVPDKLIYRN